MLIITYYWPPTGGAGVQRWLKFTKYLPINGWKPVVFTPENPEAPVLDSSLLDDVPDEAQIIKTKIWEPYSWYKKFLGIKKEATINAGFLTETEKPRLKEKISVWIRGNLFIPDARKFWIRPSIRFLTRYLQSTSIDLVITTGPPHSMHLIGLRLKQLMNIPWIADFRDPWTDIDFYDQLLLTRKADRKHHRLEKNVLEQADRVISVGKTMGKGLKKHAQVDPVILPNGFDETDFSGPDGERDPGFTLVHIGAINRDRNHLIFWESIRDLIDQHPDFAESLQIKFIGKLDISVHQDIHSFKLGRYIQIIEYMPHEQIAGELKKARLLYLPINRTPNAKSISTGKIFEYLASCRYILGIGPVDSDASEILQETGSGKMIDFEDQEGFTATLQDLFRKYCAEALPEPATPPDQYSRRALTGKLAELMNSLVEGG